MHGQHVLKYLPVPTALPSTVAFPTFSTAPRQPDATLTDIGHYLLGHPHEEALTKLLLAADGEKVIKSSLSLCESCAVANAKQIVS